MTRMTAQRPEAPNGRRDDRATRPARRGVAMLLVLGVVVMGSVLGYAMLSSAAMQKQATRSADAIAGAQGMAESGVNLAIYYLQNPGQSPTFPTSYAQAVAYDTTWGYWQGTGDQYVDFGTPSVGSVKVAVRRVDAANRGKYEITSFGRAPGGTLARKVVATVQVNSEYHMGGGGLDYAGAFTSDALLTKNTIVNGNVYSNAGLALRTGGQINGYAIRRAATSTQVVPTWHPAPRAPLIVPTPAQVRSYETYEYPKGTTNSATTLNVTAIGGGQVHQRLDPTPSNPAGVYIVPGNLTLHGGALVNGTLIVKGNLTIIPSTLGDQITVRRAQPGFPALVVLGNPALPAAGNVNFNALLSVAPVTRIDGLTYVAGRMDTTIALLLPTLEINGALLVNGTYPVFMSLGTATLRVNQDPELARVPDFTEVGRTPMSVKVNAWDAR